MVSRLNHIRLLNIVIFLFSSFLLWANNITSQENESTFLGKIINSETLSKESSYISWAVFHALIYL